MINLVKLLIFSLILTPSISFMSGVPALRLDDFLTGILLAFLLFNRFRMNKRIVFLCLFFVLLPLSIFSGLSSDFNASYGDLIQFYRYAKFIVIYIFLVYVFSRFTGHEIFCVLKFFMSCGLGLAIIVIFQYFDIFGLNKLYVHLIAPTQYHTLVGGYPFPRAVGMIGNPNEVGFIFVIISIISLYSLWKYDFRKVFLYIPLFFVGMVMTLSRSSFIAFIAAVFIFIVCFLFFSSPIKSLGVFILFSLFSSFFICLSQESYIYEKVAWRYESGMDIMSNSSMGARFNNWQENLDLARSSPIIGVGPLRRMEMEHAADNEWLLLWRSYGIVGVFLIILFFTSGVFSRRPHPDKALLYSIVVSSFLYMIPATIFHSLVLFPLVIFVFAILDRRKDMSFISQSIDRRGT
ncbi:O-antigen ligase family protein [Marinobacter sp. Arc7-DN-1]|uniref:O-antigen ligase family protein n=1 Tax=Marinobacter sp. Arc7-DN-1 TaxID=2304594 RepID=UPI000E43B16E|nr:O-antigen ligase family protein [Marinobacter sp. Arc7-DN-1]AXS82515.1 O-antigen ligase domain-containing protein [Marinobacter sp. Arc7-DN-1]